MTYYNAEDDLWFDAHPRGNGLLIQGVPVPAFENLFVPEEAWRAQVGLHYGSITGLPLQSFRDMATPITDVEKFRAAFPQRFQQLDQQTHP